MSFLRIRLTQSLRTRIPFSLCAYLCKALFKLSDFFALAVPGGFGGKIGSARFVIPITRTAQLAKQISQIDGGNEFDV